MNDELKSSIQDLVLLIQDLDISDEAKAEHLNLIDKVVSDPSSANIEALLVVLEALAEMHNLSIQETIDELKVTTQV
jgi:hypothetical protein